MHCVGKATHLGSANCGFSCQCGTTRAEHCQGHAGAVTAIVHPMPGLWAAALPVPLLASTYAPHLEKLK